MKKLLNILSAIFVSFAAFAQSFTGTWEVFPNFSNPTVLVETPEYVYTLAGTSLIGYDKTTDEMAAYNTAHRLNGNAVSGIWYDPEARYLFVAYTDYNIDLVYDDGRTINVPDLRDAAINTDKTINGVAFYDGKAYVGSNSGLLVVDAQYGAVTESCLWGKQINLIGVTPGKLLIYYTGGDRWYVADRTASHHNFDKAFARSNNGAAYPTNKALLSAAGKVAFISKNVAYLLNVKDEAANADAITGTTQIATGIEDKNLQVTKDGFTFAGTGKAHRVNATTAEVTTVDAPKDNKVASWDGTDLWLANSDGICQTGSEAPRLKPNSTSGSNVGIFRQSPDGTIYLSTSGYASSFSKGGVVPKFDYYADGKITPVPALSSLGKTNMYDFAFDPHNPENVVTVFFSFVARTNLNTGETLWYNQNNSNFGSYPTNSVTFDSYGNIWATQWNTSKSEWVLHKGLADKWINSEDKNVWSTIVLPGMTPEHQNLIFYDSKYNLLLAASKFTWTIIELPGKDEPLNENIRMALCQHDVDEDGGSAYSWYTRILVQDKNGWIWAGMHDGVYVIKDSREMFNSGYAPMRPKVPRNDGTNLADYLLENVEIEHIAVDENNEKWISTNGSGLYHVNADGSEIIEHFTASNSEIPSDVILACYPDKLSNKIFVGTNQGLAIYHSTSAPAKSDLKDVYAYPNPVTPEYTGYINIAGLMDDTLVKIADAAGNVLFQGKSSGGMITWNGCDSSGRRVKSGVYYVFASKSGENTNSDAFVTKIVVVN